MHPCRGILTLVVLASSLLVPVPAAMGAPAPPRPATVPTRVNDVDGDGRADLVLVDAGDGDFFDPQASHPRRVGGIRVLFADGRRQTVTRRQLHALPGQDSRFGAGLAVGDLNRDGYADIVVADSSANDFGGIVWAIWGGPDGISARRVQVLLKGSPDRPVGAGLAFLPVPEPVLAVGVEAVLDRPGGLWLFQVTPSGRLGASLYLTIGSPGITAVRAGQPELGRTLAASGDLLVAGASQTGPKPSGGAAWVLQLQRGLRYWAIRVTQDTAGVPGRTETDDNFGASVSVLNDRVAIAVPGERVRRTELRGAIQPIRVERTLHGLVLHPDRLTTREHARLVDRSRRSAWELQVRLTACRRDYAALVDAGLRPVPLARTSRCPTEPLEAGTGFGIVRNRTGGAAIDDQPAVISGDAVIVGWRGRQRTYPAGSTADEWLLTGARIAPPAA